MLEVVGLSKRYLSGRGHIEAIAQITFQMEKGTNLTLVGKSGSGKTTLMNCVGGIERPDTGKVVVEGQEIQSLSERDLCLFQRRHIGFVFQHGNLLSFLTVAENIAFPLNLNSFDRSRREHRVSELLDLVGLTGIGAAMPYELSGGELQRIAIARALSHSPSLLLADEPTANLDSATGITVIQMMIDLTRNQRCTLVMATHDPELMALSDRTILLRDGLLQDDHPKEEVTRGP
jgi:ABC-type lipoprotein export system ATPase subunit